MTANEKDRDPNEVARAGAEGEGETEPETGSPGTEETLKELEDARREVETLRDQLLRKAAEFENYRRRIDGEFRTIIQNASENLIRDLLPVLDDFDRLLKVSREQPTNDALREGFELITSKLNKILSLRGLASFESLGKPFDVQYHDALLQIPRDDVPPNTVIEEVSRGYHLNDKILRHAKVVVSSPAATDGPTDTGTGKAGPGESSE